MDWSKLGQLIFNGTIETILMTGVSSLFAISFGVIVGVILYLVQPKGLLENRFVYAVLDVTINILRSLPFLILLIAITPLTRLIVRTSIGLWATVVPLIVASIPFVSRLVETCLNRVDKNLIEMAQSLGATNWQIIRHVVLVEAWPALIENFSIASITILGYGVMAGFVGGGGLGSIAINYGYYRNEPLIMLSAVIMMIIIVQLLQMLGNKLSINLNKSK